MILEKRKSAQANNYFLGAPGSGLNNSLALGYSADSEIIHAQGSNSYPSGISAYSNSKDKPRVFIFTHSASNGNKTYINGVLAGEDSAATSHLSGISTLSIGQGYVGEIGEIAILTKALGGEDRKLVEDYLGKKWSSPINSSKAADCLSGLVTTGGCDNSSAVTCSASGPGYSKTGLTYTSGSSFSCDSGFEGTINYACSRSGVATVSGSCAPITCTAPAGTGYSAKTGLAYAAAGSGSFACDSGYSGAINYTCTASGAAATTGSCSIACSASGGTITSVADSTIHTFTTVGTYTFSCPIARNAQVLVVAGGGSGGSAQDAGGGGGGGGGGVVYALSYPLSATSYSITVGAGGASVNYTNNSNVGIIGANGSDSIFGTITAKGGGGGGTCRTTPLPITAPGNPGGSGGGAGGAYGASGGVSNQLAQTNASNFYGNAGGSSPNGSPFNAGGGGGAGGPGTAASLSVAGGGGGAGIANTITGSSIIYGAGGGGSGGWTSSAGGVGGSSGMGGAGGVGHNVSSSGTNGSSIGGTAGNGGGGANRNASGAGSNGIVIIRYTN